MIMRRMRTALKSKEGFTLVELLVVLMVLGVLAAVAVPRISDISGKAQEVKAKTELKQVQTAMEVYLAENGTYPTSTSEMNDALDFLMDSDLDEYTVKFVAGDADDFEITVTPKDNNLKFTVTIKHSDLTIVPN